jgi:cytochrome P450
LNPISIEYDPYDYELDRDPHPVWKRLREEAPVYYNERYDFWALSRFRDVLDASLDHEGFSSARGTVLEMMDEPLANPPMIFMDPPRHTAFRKLLSRTFTPRRISGLESRIRSLCAGYLDPLVGAREFDYLAAFGARLPVMVISSLLGVPEEDQDQLRIWSDQTLHREPGETGPSQASRAATQDIFAYWMSQIETKRSHPVDDVLSDLVTAEIQLSSETPRPLSDAELLSFCLLISSAGNETVARFLGWAITLLESHPEERDRLVENPRLIPNAVEEILRFEAPSPIQARWVTRDVEIHGTIIPKDSKIALLTASANRDEREFPDADRFDVTRRVSQHMSLGLGVHFCLGASLARLEARVALDETLRRFPKWQVDRDGLEMVHTSTVRGYAHVPIRPL